MTINNQRLMINKNNIINLIFLVFYFFIDFDFRPMSNGIYENKKALLSL